MKSDSAEMLRWFELVGQRYVAAYLAPRVCDIERLRHDPEYGLKQFLFTWAFERSHVPRRYRIAAVKALAAVWPDVPKVSAQFVHFNRGKTNARRNPALDPRLATLCIPQIVAFVEQARLAEAFHGLALNGVGHKIRSFFLRDLICLTTTEGQLHGLASYLYCQPIDLWVRETARALVLPAAAALCELPSNKEYGFESRDDRDLAATLICGCLSADVSPLHVNQGIWYFCSNAVADTDRLHHLLSFCDTRALSDELALLDGFLP
ncbi:MAG: hypothetical protein ACLQUY_21070 [Ktedonobacterales bacterium]